jgi:hypothetical protein
MESVEIHLPLGLGFFYLIQNPYKQYLGVLKSGKPVEI